jgi:pyruvate/2-oxoglutarate dehydrogenase complex dihydrolipoamide dehydrogenase (E3) component
LIPSIPGLDTIPYFTSATIFDNPRKLTHLVIIGGGPVGLEMAQAYVRLGSAVTVVDIATPLAASDPELAALALRRIAEEGVVIHANTTVVRVQARSQGIGVIIRPADAEQTLDASHVLVATGRVPNLDRLDLAKANIRLRKGGTQLLLRPDLRTTNAAVYAIGDAAGGAQHSHAAMHHADLVVESAILGRRVRHDAALVPSVVFTDPEIAEVGLTEPEARQKHGENYRVLRLSFSENDRARTERQSFGLVKLVTDRTGKLLGAGIVGTAAAEMIALYGFAIGNHMSVSHFRNFVAPYPTLAAVAQGLADEAMRQQTEGGRVSPLLKLRRMLPLP